MAVFILAASGSTWAKIYQIPADLLVESQHNEAILKQNPQDANAIFESSMSDAYTGQIEKGWAQLKTIPTYDKNYAPKVIAKYSALIQHQPKEWRNYFKIAFGYYFSDRKDLAIENFKKVLDISPKNIWAMGFIGLIEGERGNTDEGIAWSQKALDIEPNATAIHFLIAEGYRRKGDYIKAFGHMLIVGRLKSEEAIARKSN